MSGEGSTADCRHLISAGSTLPKVISILKCAAVTLCHKCHRLGRIAWVLAPSHATHICLTRLHPAAHSATSRARCCVGAALGMSSRGETRNMHAGDRLYSQPSRAWKAICGGKIGALLKTFDSHHFSIFSAMMSLAMKPAQRAAHTESQCQV